MGSKLSKCTEEQEPLFPASAKRDKLSVQCVNDQEALNAVVDFGDAVLMIHQTPLLVHDVDPLALNTVVYSRAETSPALNQLPLPVQCVDDPTGLNAVVAVEGQSYSNAESASNCHSGRSWQEDFKPI
ncbi:uncharacterized protein Hap1MRO34_021721 isoform 2-T2 [Clarias gariepinus]